MQMSRIRRRLERARGVREALPQLKEEVRSLREENKRLRNELKKRPQKKEEYQSVAALRPPASGEADVVAERFHLLYRETRRLDKQTWWRGVRVIKCPLDLWIYQELISELRPDLIVETGTMYGGSAYYLASMLDLVGNGEILTIDRNVREERPEHERITYLTGSSVDEAIVAEAARRAEGKDTVMVLLDSNHKAAHVLAELRAYHPLVTPGSYLVVEDTNINGHPVEPDFGPGPMEALERFLEENDDFEPDLEREKFLLTFNPHGWLRRKPAGAS